MAKLENVKLIEVVGGVISEIEYGGESYKKVEVSRGDVKVGDIVQNDVDREDAAKGSFYEVVPHDEYGTTVRDDVGASHTNIIYNGDVFRKVSAPAITERVDELETRVSALEA